MGSYGTGSGAPISGSVIAVDHLGRMVPVFFCITIWYIPLGFKGLTRSLSDYDYNNGSFYYHIAVEKQIYILA